MSTIDTLVLELGLDASSFTQQQKDSLSQFKKTQDEMLAGGKNVEAMGQRIGEGFNTVKRQLLGITALFLGGRGIKEFVSYVTTLDASTGRLSKSLNIGVRDLAAWQSVFEQIGGTKESAGGAIQGITSAMHGALITGQIPAFARFIDMFKVDANGVRSLKDAGEVIKDMADYVKGFNPADAAAFISAVLPGANQDSINLILRGREAIDKYFEAGRKASNMTKESAAESEKYQRSISLLETSMTSLGRTIVIYVAGPLAAAADKLRELFQLWNSDKGEIDKVAEKTRADITKRIGEPRTLVENAVKFGLRTGVIKSKEGQTDDEAARRFSDSIYGPRAPAPEPKPSSVIPPAPGYSMSGRRFPQETQQLTSSGLNPDAQRLLDAIAAGESSGRYDVMYGRDAEGKQRTFSNYAEHPNQAAPITSGPNQGKVSTAAGRYQMINARWMEAKKALDLPDFSPASQDKAAWWLAKRDYRDRSGRDLLADLQSGDSAVIDNIGRVLSRTWTSLPSGIEQNRTGEQFGNAVKGPASFRPGAPAAATTGPGAFNDSSTKRGDTTTTTTVTVGKVDVNAPNATDADGVAKEFTAALSRQARLVPADTGLTG